MGTDNLFHKRKAEKVKRRQREKSDKPTVLIVCEDSISTPTYLEMIKDELKLVQLRIDGEQCGSAPITVINYAIEKKKQENYNKVFCVIDRDKHSDFKSALDKAKSNDIELIISIPCFEYWLLLHFEDTTSPFQAGDGSSDCDKLIKKLKIHLTDYGKNKIFFRKNYKEKLKNREDIAIKRAKERLAVCKNEEIENQNPSTKFYVLIEYLRSLKK